MHTQYEIGVIGAGNAAEGIVNGILRQSVLLDDRIIASDPAEMRRELFRIRGKSGCLGLAHAGRRIWRSF